jgi:hypothetical protein
MPEKIRHNARGLLMMIFYDQVILELYDGMHPPKRSGATHHVKTKFSKSTATV